jgi:crooked neck
MLAAQQHWMCCFHLQVYERAVANLPPGNEKRFWQRYIYLWIKYALFEELDAGDMDKAREVYR